MYNHILIGADTDSVLINKANGDPWTEEEREEFLNNLNSLFPEKINFEDDGYFAKVIVLKAKNYLLWDGKKAKIRG